MRSSRAVIAALVSAAVGCGPSAAYDGLTGGSRQESPTDPGPVSTTTPVQQNTAAVEDATLPSPRPLAPLSATLVASKRPHLRWQNPSGAIGAIVELSTTRAFEPDATKRFDTEGEELDVPEDLAPGIWYWRLRTRAPGKFGSVASPTWQMLVRGPMKKGASPGASGSILDIDGNGEPDLVTVADTRQLDDAGQVQTSPTLVVYTSHGGSLAHYVDITFPSAAGGDVFLAGGPDVDGDGYSDVAHSGLTKRVDATTGVTTYPCGLEYGSAQGLDEDKWSTTGIDFASAPSRLASGDLDGDGFGDVLQISDARMYLSYGSASGADLLRHLGTFPMGVTVPVTAGFDADGDGNADFAFGGDAEVAGEVVAGNRGSVFERHVLLTPARPGVGTQLRAVASGDFDGDGLADLAATSALASGGFVVCVHTGDRAMLSRYTTCVDAKPGDLDFGAALTAVDLDGDGTDELLVTARDGSGMRVDAVSLTSNLVETIATGVGTALTTVWPGHPGKGRWAATTATSDAIHVYEGTTLRQTLLPDASVVSGFGRALR